MFLLNSRLGHFSAASLHWHPFSRGYGVILPSSLTTLLSLVLGFSPHLPVSVCGTGTCYLVSSFSRQCEISSFVTLFSLPITPQPYQHAVFPTCQPWCLDTVNQLRARLILLRPHVVQTILGGTGISTCCPSPTPFGLGLGPD